MFFKNVLSQKRCYSGASVAYQGQSGTRSALYEESLLVSHSPELSQQIFFYNFFWCDRNKDLENHCYFQLHQQFNSGIAQEKSEKDIYLF